MTRVLQHASLSESSCRMDDSQYTMFLTSIPTQDSQERRMGAEETLLFHGVSHFDRRRTAVRTAPPVALLPHIEYRTSNVRNSPRLAGQATCHFSTNSDTPGRAPLRSDRPPELCDSSTKPGFPCWHFGKAIAGFGRNVSRKRAFIP